MHIVLFYWNVIARLARHEAMEPTSHNRFVRSYLCVFSLISAANKLEWLIYIIVVKFIEWHVSYTLLLVHSTLVADSQIALAE
jgi:hypothetical protein